MHSGPGNGTSKVLKGFLFITSIYVAVLIVAGIRAHSPALLSGSTSRAVSLTQRNNRRRYENKIA
jgi:hypothetical protein